MGKKKKNSGSAAGKKTKYKNTQAKNQAQNPESMEESLQKRSRFATEHLKHLEALYREGLNLEDELLKEEKLSAEELQGALDELETMQDVRSAAEYISEADASAGQHDRNATADVFRPGAGPVFEELPVTEESEKVAETGYGAVKAEEEAESATETEKAWAEPESVAETETGVKEQEFAAETKAGRSWKAAKYGAKTGNEAEIAETGTEKDVERPEFVAGTKKAEEEQEFVAETEKERIEPKSAAETEREKTETESVAETEKEGIATGSATGTEKDGKAAGSGADAEEGKDAPENVAETVTDKEVSAENVSVEKVSEELVAAEEMTDGIPLAELTSAGLTLGELADAGITAETFHSDGEVPAESSRKESASWNSNAHKSAFGETSSWGSASEEATPWDSASEGAVSWGSASEEATPWDSASGGAASWGSAFGETTSWGSASEETLTGETGSGGAAPAEMVSEDPAGGNSETLTSEELTELLEENELSKPMSAGGENPSAAEKSENSDASGGGGESEETDGPRRKSGLSKKTGMIQIAVFFIALFGISIVGLCMPLRPTESQIEKRTLTEFPEFTWESFLSGDYTDQISTWYADTFPFRETLLSWYTSFKKLFGIQGSEVYIGDVIVADDIPDIPDEDETTTLATDTDASGTDATEATTPEETTAETTTEAPTETTTEAPTETTTQEPTETVTEAQTTTAGGSDSSVAGEQIGSVYIYGDQAFSVYGFSLEMSDNYAKMISLAAEELAGKATVYNILVPLSYGIQLDSSLWESMGWSDEEKAIKYMYSQMSGDVKTVSIYQALLEHKDEYIYFRTDHHWTALGAYYAYQCFAGVKGITANALDSFETMTFENYLGSLYSQSNESQALASNPDTITAYLPHGTNKITITQKNGSILDWRVIYDVTTWRNDSKYSCFIGGDNPFSVIENPEITDGSSVLLVKESFGNAFAPFLVDHYQYVYIIDFRYYSGHLEEVVDTYGIQDVIFMNNLNSAGGSLQNYLQSFIEPEEETGTGQ